MYYTYVLLSEKDGKHYTGYTQDLKLRFQQHQNGEVESTKHRRPLKLIYYEDKYGTPENLKINSNINNITQLRDKLIELFKIEEYQEEVNEFISKKILFGTLEVDMLTNKEMRFKGQ